MIHQWLFPWRMRRNLESVGFQILKFRPDAICLPWFSQAIPVMRVLDGLGSLPILREIGIREPCPYGERNKKCLRTRLRILKRQIS